MVPDVSLPCPQKPMSHLTEIHTFTPYVPKAKVKVKLSLCFLN